MPGTPSITRRDLLRGAAAGALGAVAAGSVAAASGCSSDTADVDVLDVSEDDVVTLDSFKELSSSAGRVDVDDLCTLNGGTILGGTGSAVCAAILASDTANPLNRLALLGLQSGRVSTVRQRAVGHKKGFEFLSARASNNMIVWVESNFLTSEWRVYCAGVRQKALSIHNVVLLDSGDADWDAPAIEAVGNTVFWIVQPSEDGQKTTEDSHLKASAAGASPVVVHTSHGRFCGGLCASGGVVTAMPRVDTSGVYYQLTAFESTSGSVISSQVMPASFRPQAAVFMDGKFSFTIGASYDYGGGISEVGTYFPLDDGTWLRLVKQPYFAPGIAGGWLFSKSGARTVLVDLDNRAYLTVDAPEGSADWGDCPICIGKSRRVFVFATVDDDSSYTSTKVRVRAITPR